MGRPRVPLRDGIFAATMKVYGKKSGRDSVSVLRVAEERGLVGSVPSHVSVARVIERADLTPLLTSLVNESAKPLARVETETQYAVDSTGFATTTYDRWFDYRYGTPEPKRRQRFVKLHALVGTHTHVIAGVRVTDMHGADSPEFAPLLKQVAANGVEMREVSADKAYLSHDNLAATEALGAAPFIPLKSNSTGTGSPQMERLAAYVATYEDDFLAHYHRRSNVETVFHMIKAKFDAAVRSKLPAAQTNEVLLKCLCHNLSCLVLAIHELNIDPKFWMPKALASVGGAP
jgi:transposase